MITDCLTYLLSDWGAEGDIKTESLKPPSVQSPRQAASAGRGGLDINRCGSTFLVFEYVEVGIANIYLFCEQLR